MGLGEIKMDYIESEIRLVPEIPEVFIEKTRRIENVIDGQGHSGFSFSYLINRVSILMYNSQEYIEDMIYTKITKEPDDMQRMITDNIKEVVKAIQDEFQLDKMTTNEDIVMDDKIIDKHMLKDFVDHKLINLLNHKPISPLTFEPDQWYLTSVYNGEKEYRHKRDFRVTQHSDGTRTQHDVFIYDGYINRYSEYVIEGDSYMPFSLHISLEELEKIRDREIPSPNEQLTPEKAGLVIKTLKE